MLADSLSGHRFGDHVAAAPICGGYDSYLAGVDWPEPDVVVRFGASPTSKVLRKYLAGVDARQYLVDPAGGWREAEFTTTDLVVADETAFAQAVAERSLAPAAETYRDRFARAEDAYWNAVEEACDRRLFEGGLVHAVAEGLPDPATCFVSNSMPVRDLDRFSRPRAADVSVLGNRGVSGIDGIVSSGLGAGSASEEPLVLLVGDLALYHDMNGLLALERCGVDATIVLLDNDGGGIFHKLPIEEFDPPFTEQFRTPHGLDFSAVEGLYDLDFRCCESRQEFLDGFERSVGSGGTDLLAVEFDSEASHRYREGVHEEVTAAVREAVESSD